MDPIKTLAKTFAVFLSFLALDARELAFDRQLSGWKKVFQNKVFADTAVKLTKECSLRLENGGRVIRRIPVESDTKYELTFYVKGKEIEAGSNRGARIMLNCGKYWARATASPKGAPDTGTFDWKIGTFTVDTAKFTGNTLSVSPSINGKGTVWYDRITFRKLSAGRKKAENKISYKIDLFPANMEGGDISFCENYPGQLQILSSGKGNYTGKKAEMTMDIPRFIKLNGVLETFPLLRNGQRKLKPCVVRETEITREGIRYRRYKIAFEKHFLNWINAVWYRHLIFLQADAGSNGKQGKIYWSFDIGGESQPEKVIRVKVTEPVKVVAAPCKRFALWMGDVKAVSSPFPQAAKLALDYWSSLAVQKFVQVNIRNAAVRYPGFQIMLALQANDSYIWLGADEFNKMSKILPRDVTSSGKINASATSIWSMVDDPQGIYERYFRNTLRKIKKHYPRLKHIWWDFEPHPYGYDEGGRRRFAQKTGLKTTPSIAQINRSYSNQWFNYMVKLHAEHIARNAQMIREELPGVKFWFCSDNLWAAEPHISRWCGVDVSLSDPVVDVHNHMPYYTGSRYYDDVRYNIGKLKKPFLPLIDPAERIVSFYKQYSAPAIEQNIVATAALGGAGIGFWPDDVMPGKYYYAIASGFGKVSKAESYYFDGTRCDKEIRVTPKNVVVKNLLSLKKITYPDFSQKIRFTAHKLKGKYLITLFNYDHKNELIAEISGKNLKPFLVKVKPSGVELAGNDFMPPQETLKKEIAAFSGDASIFKDHVSSANKAVWNSGAKGLPVIELSDGKISVSAAAFSSCDAVSLKNAAGAEFLTQVFCGRLFMTDRLQPKVIFKRTGHGISREGVPYFTAEAEVGPYEGANPDPNPLYGLKIIRKLQVKKGRLVISHTFINPTGKPMPLKARLNNFPWPGHRFNANNIQLNGKSSYKDQTILKPAWNGGTVTLLAGNGVLSESITFEPDKKFTGIFSWFSPGSRPRQTVEFLVDQTLLPQKSIEYTYIVTPGKEK